MLEIKYLSPIEVTQVNCNQVLKFENFKAYTDGVNKLILMSVRNIFNETLTSITFKITQYDEGGNRLKREVKSLTDLCVRRKKSYETEELTKVDVMMHHIEIEIISVNFITISYDHGALSSTCVKRDKAAGRKQKRIQKLVKKHPRKAKKLLRDIIPYSFNISICKSAAFVAVLCGIFMCVVITIICCFYCKGPSSITIFTDMAKLMLKGGVR